MKIYPYKKKGVGGGAVLAILNGGGGHKMCFNTGA